MNRLAVYCGHHAGGNSAYTDAARDLAREMTERDIDLVYGGGKLGLMGIMADEVLSRGGKVFGVIPQSLVDVEVAHTGLTELYPVPGMHERKAKMTELTDAFVCLPGGIGTMDELMEAWTWNALGYHSKPFCLLNIDGFWEGFAQFCDTVTDQGFMSEDRRRQLLMADTPADAIDKLDAAAKAAQDGFVW